MNLYVVPVEFTIVAPDPESALDQLSSFLIVSYRDIGPTFAVTDFEMNNDDYVQEIVITDETGQSGRRNNH